MTWWLIIAALVVIALVWWLKRKRNRAVSLDVKFGEPEEDEKE